MADADAGGAAVKLLEQCHVSLPPNSTLPPYTSLPLTFLDLPWLFFSHTKQPLFFFDFHHSISHFSLYTLPNLKLSLSLTLQHYFTFAATLAVTSSSKPHIAYTPQNSVSFKVAQSLDDFNTLIANHARNADAFQYLVPTLSLFRQNDDDNNTPLFAVQITVFPNTGGICIGLAFHNVIADGRTFNNFIKTWAAYCRSGSSLSLKNLSFYDRSVIVDPNGLEEVFLREWKERVKVVNGCDEFRVKSSSEMVRATFLMGPTQMDNIKRWIVNSCQNKNQPLPIHLSAYVLTCAFLWVCLVKAQQIRKNKELFASDLDPDPAFFGFIAGGLTRMPFDVPKMYLGNCVGFGRAVASRKELTGEDGIVVAARAIGGTIKKLDNAVLAGAEKWVSDWDEMYGSELHVVATWSPKLDLYETDFGWGKPRKIEEISIDRSREISLIESRDIEGGMEIGLALPKTQMDTFTMLFNQGLDALS